MKNSLEKPTERRCDKIGLDPLDRKLIKGLTAIFAMLLGTVLWMKTKEDRIGQVECTKAANSETRATENLPLGKIQEYCHELGIEISDKQVLEMALANLENGKEVSGRLLKKLNAIKLPQEAEAPEN